jgi:hypothetical protein
MKYSITQNASYRKNSVSPRANAAKEASPPESAVQVRGGEAADNDTENADTVVAPRSPSYAVDDAIAMTASAFVPQVKVNKPVKLPLNEDIPTPQAVLKSTHDAFVGGNSVLSNLRPYGDMALSSDRDYTQYNYEKLSNVAKDAVA